MEGMDLQLHICNKTKDSLKTVMCGFSSIIPCRLHLRNMHNVANKLTNLLQCEILLSRSVSSRPSYRYVFTFGKLMTLAGAFTIPPFAFVVACPVELLMFAVSFASIDFFVCQSEEKNWECLCVCIKV